jgi:hypothetical protein
MAAGPDFLAVSINALSQMTGRDRRWIKRRLGEAGVRAVDGRTGPVFSTPAALEAIYKPGDSALNPQIERAALDRARREEIERRAERERGEWVPASGLDRSLIALATAVSGKMQALPRALAVRVAAESSPAACERILDDGIRSALFDLSEEGRVAAEKLELEAQRSQPRRRRA